MSCFISDIVGYGGTCLYMETTSMLYGYGINGIGGISLKPVSMKYNMQICRNIVQDFIDIIDVKYEWEMNIT